ncbi:MAG: alpha/beta hydrolase [Bifidobacteriaceae bacterium]|jgi:pimeloyl-ACP methyl ester carboxylesterase|nr:alpha/beta hydrolase [Bifidobacteriaceae bacterium]
MILGELSAQVDGAGPPVVMLHGNSESSAVFDRMLPYLEGFTLIRLDSRGHGASQRGSGPLTIARLAQDTCGALRAYQRLSTSRQRFGLIGFSDGANIGLEVAIHRPNLLAAEVLIGGNTTPAALKKLIRAEILAGYWALAAAGQVNSRARRRAEVFGLMVNQPNVTKAQLKAVTVPTLVMAGQRDIVPRGESQRVASLVPGAQWVELTGQGHLLPRTAPDLTGQLAAAFLRPHLAV